MDQPARRTSPLLWVGLGLTLAFLLLALLMVMLRVRTAAKATQKLPVLSTIAAFTLTNQNGRVFTSEDLKGKVWVADIIFTRCAGPCLTMSKQMSQLQKTLPEGAVLVSLTTDPEYDSPEVLKTYAARFDANPVRWQFLTGTKKQIGALATGSLKLTGIEKAPEEQQDPADLFIHSTIFVLVDKHLRLRGVYETEGPGIDRAQVRGRILAGIKKLEHEQ